MLFEHPSYGVVKRWTIVCLCPFISCLILSYKRSPVGSVSIVFFTVGS